MYMKKNKFYSGVIVSSLILFSPASQAGLFSNFFDAIFDGVGQMGRSNNGNGNNSNSGSGSGSSNNNNSSGFGNGMTGGSGNISNNNNNLSGGSQVSPGSPNGSAVGTATTQNVIVVASNPGMIPIPRCSTGTFKNIKFPRYSAGVPQAMPAGARPEIFAADLPSGADGTKTTVACSNAIPKQPKAMDGNDYRVDGDLHFACISGSWMLEDSTCHAVIVPPAANSAFAGGGGTTAPSGQTLNGVTCPTGSTPTATTTGYGTGVECTSNTSIGGYGNQTVPACGTNIYSSQAGC